ncbi:MAG: LysR family transcriptional regulator [Lachnospiraceae bacterium]|nr:LysR family transcriptional regulator [Lachnospiraceae bacterium]
MELRQIQYFDAVFRDTSISKAAQNLFVTQQCISKQISMLEKEFGVALLKRNPNGVTPTEEGLWFQEHAAMILQIEQDIQTHYEMLRKGGPDVVRIGVSNGLNLFFDDTFFHRLRAAHSEQMIQVSYMWNRQIEEMIERNELDIGISLLPVQNDSLYVKKLFTEQLCCIVNSHHKLAGYETLHFEDIMREHIAMADENYNTFHSFMARCKAQGVMPDIYKASDLMSIYVYVLNHDAVGFSLNTFADRFQIHQIRHILYEDAGGVWDVCALLNEKCKNRFSAYTNDFSTLLLL